VKKYYKRKEHVKWNWKLKEIEKDVEEIPKAKEKVSKKSGKYKEKETDLDDWEIFFWDIEEDKEMRLQMRLFKIEEKPVKAKLEVELKQEEEAKI